MALIQCNECGRTVSDKALVCIGCGAPLSSAVPSDRNKIFNLVPEPDRRLPPTRQQLLLRAIICAATFVGGVIWSSSVSGSANRSAVVVAGLLVVVGLCGVIVTAIQFPWTRK